MLIEIHLLQNHSPSNPNRDDLGAPKTAWFGGRLRGRISSQCLKRSIRRWPEFQAALKGHLGKRTKLFPYLVGERIKEANGAIKDEKERSNIVNACRNIARGDAKEEPVERGKKVDDRAKTPQLVFLQDGHVEEFVRNLERLRGEMKSSYDFFCNPTAAFEQEVQAQLELRGTDAKEAKAIGGVSWVIAKSRQSVLFESDEAKPEGWNSDAPDPAQLADYLYELGESDPARLKELRKKPTAAEKKNAAPEAPKDYKKFLEHLYAPLQLNAVDIALFGRMTTSEAFEDVEAAVEVAHAISTNAVQQEADYFTAVDDMALPGAGAGHVGESQFNSCTYYKYFSLDWSGLVERLAGKQPSSERLAEVKALAARAVKAFIEAAWHAVPTGKKKGHAHNDPASAILVEIKERPIPTNYANAFVKPAAPTDEHDLIEDSIRKLGQYVGCTVRSNGVAVKSRIWHAARGEALEYLEPVLLAADGKRSKAQPPQPVPDTVGAVNLREVIRATLAILGSDIDRLDKGAGQ